MSDLIDRQAAIDALDKRFDSIPMGLTTEILQLRRDLRELPSVQPDKEALEDAYAHGYTYAESQFRKMMVEKAAQNVPMNDLISRQAAIEALLDKGQRSRRYRLGDIWELNFDEIREAIKELPSARPEIIRCSECKYGAPNGKYGCRLERFAAQDESERMYENDFCSQAERK